MLIIHLIKVLRRTRDWVANSSEFGETSHTDGASPDHLVGLNCFRVRGPGVCEISCACMSVVRKYMYRRVPHSCTIIHIPALCNGDKFTVSHP